MTFRPETRVLVASVKENLSPALMRTAVRHAWPVVTVSRATQALREIRYRQPEVVIVQVSSPLDEDIELIRLLPARMKQLSLIAVADPHHDEIERAVRGSGASCYLPNATDSALVERTVAEMLSRRRSEIPKTRRASDAASNNKTSSPPPFCLLRIPGGGPDPPAARAGAQTKSTEVA